MLPTPVEEKQPQIMTFRGCLVLGVVYFEEKGTENEFLLTLCVVFYQC